MNLPCRLSQLRESGVLFRLRQHYLPSPQPDAEPSSIVVSLVTVAPILVLILGGNLLGLLILVIERCLHWEIFKTWPTRYIRRPHNLEYRLSGPDRRLLYLLSCNTTSDATRLRWFLIVYCIIFLEISASNSTHILLQDLAYTYVNNVTLAEYNIITLRYI